MVAISIFQFTVAFYDTINRPRLTARMHYSEPQCQWVVHMLVDPWPAAINHDLGSSAFFSACLGSEVALRRHFDALQSLLCDLAQLRACQKSLSVGLCKLIWHSFWRPSGEYFRGEKGRESPSTRTPCPPAGARPKRTEISNDSRTKAAHPANWVSVWGG